MIMLWALARRADQNKTWEAGLCAEDVCGSGKLEVNVATSTTNHSTAHTADLHS
jgi:hypothetical protein